MMKNYLFLTCFLFLTFFGFAQTVVYQEGFETLPLSVTSSGNPGWSRSNVYAKTGSYSDSSRVAQADTSYLRTASFSSTGNSYVVLEFAHICKIEAFDGGIIEVSTNGGVSWTKLVAAQYLGAGQFGNQGDRFSSVAYPIWDPGNAATLPQNLWWRTETFDISTIAANQANVMVRFKLYDGNNNGHNGNYGWLIDDIKVTAAPSELIPPVITLQTPIIQDTLFTTNPYEIKALITDASGIDTAYVTYSINGGSDISIGMTHLGNNIYNAFIPSQSYSTHVDYQVFAIDNSPAANLGQSAAKWFYVKKGPDIVTIGTGTIQNTVYDYPAPYGNYWYGAKHQMMLRASELTAAGISAGEIVSVGFDVVALGGAALQGFTIKIGQTTQNDMNAWVTTPLTTVFSTASYSETLGWNTHSFTQPFLWNGTSNVVIEACFNNTGYTTNAIFNQSSTSFVSTLEYHNDASGICISTSTSLSYSQRPNMQIGIAPNTNNYDAGVFQIIEPTGTVLSGTPQNVNVRVKNFGLQTLTSAQIGWSVNGIAQTPAPWTGSLTQDQVSNPFNIGQYTFTAGPYNIKAWTYDPNGQTDEKFSNDTANASVYSCDAILNGNYTVGGVGANYPTITDALTALELCGINGPVTMNINPGTYNARIVVPQIPGISATNTVTFKGHGNSTIINYATTVSNNRAAVVLDNKKYITFDSLSIVIPDTATFGWGFFITNQSEDITIKNCSVKTSLTSTTSNHCGIVVSGSYITATTTGNNVKNLILENNTIEGGYYGVVVAGEAANKLRNMTVSMNTIKNVYYYGLYVNQSIAPIITKNSIEARTTGSAFTTSAYGLYLSATDSATVITKNRIKNVGLYGMYFTGCNSTAEPILIANNMIGGGFSSTSTPYGFYIASSSNLNIVYNSINVNSGTGRPINLLSTVSQAKVLNNSFAYTGTGNSYAAYYASTASLAAHDYNNYYVNNSNIFVYYGAAVANLAALQAVNMPADNDLNSKVGNPNYSTPTLLYPTGTQLWNSGTPLADVTDDIDGLLRSTTAPCIGAVEYAPPSDDAALVGINLPIQSSCELTNAEDIILRIKNFGTATITSINVTYKINNNTPVTETFAVNIPMDSVREVTFVTKANLAAYGVYNFDFWVNKTGDINQLNDSILGYKVYHSHDFYAGPYTQGFEPTEFFADWSILNIGGGTNTWVIPFNNASFANSGQNSAQFLNGTTNTGDDWLFSKCFNFEAGSLYEVSFYYRNSSSTVANNLELKMGTDTDPVLMDSSLVNLPGMLNLSYLKATKTFSVPVTGIYYLGWRAYSAPSTASAYIDDVNVKLIPPVEAAILAIPTPVTGCGLGLDTVSVTIKNTGASTLNTNMMVYYQANNGTVVSEQITLSNFAPNQTLTHAFTNLIDLSTAYVDSVFEFKAWINLTGDPFQFNDTIYADVVSMFVPDDPIVADVDIAYGQTASIAVATNDSLYWYNSMISTTPLFAGNPFVTPVLFDTTIYYVEASTVTSGNQTQVGTGILTQYNTPCNTWYNYSWSTSLFLPSELYFTGNIDTLTFFVNNAISNYSMSNQNIYMKHVSYSAFPDNSYPATSGMTQVFQGTVVWNGPGMVKIPLTTPFNYDGTSSLIIHWEDHNGSYISPYPIFTSTTVPNNMVNMAYSDISFPASAGSFTTLRPNIIFSHEVIGCVSNRMPVSVNVIKPNFEAEILDVVTPITETCTFGSEQVSILIKNNGQQAITSGLTASYAINNGLPVSEVVTTTVPAGGTITYTFATPFPVVITGGDTIINILAYVNHAGDPYQANDTTAKTVKLLYTPNPPTATSPVTIPYATSATLTATSPQTMKWFDLPFGGNELASGANYTTPILYDTTVYYVEANNTITGQLTTVGTGTLTTYQLPCNPFYHYSWAASIYKASELNFVGAIDSIRYFVTQSMNTYLMNDQRIYMMLTTDSSFSNANKPDPTTMTMVYTGDITWTAGWFKIPLQNQFVYDGTSHLIIYWENWDGSYVSPYPSFNYTTASTNISKYAFSDPSFPTGAGTLTTMRPNVGFSHSVIGCPSLRTPVQVNISGTPANDAGIVSVDAPASPTVFGAQNIEVSLHNYGTANLTNVTINWEVNGVPQTPFNWAGILPNAQTLPNVNIGQYSFTLGLHNFKVWTTNPNGTADIYNLNDTASTTIESFEPLNGIYTIGGTAPDYPTFTAARNALVHYGVSGPVIFKARSGIYTEKFLLPAYAGASATNTVTFMPDASATVTLTASDTFVVKILGASYYIFDGSNDGTNTQDFNILNTSTNANTSAIWLAGNNNQITVQNCKIAAGSNTVTSTFGIHLGGASISTTATGQNNNITLHNNAIAKAYFGIYAKSTAALKNTNLRITNNTIGSQNAIEYILYRGIDVAAATDPLIEGNEIFNIRTTTYISISGVEIGAEVTNAKISKNKIYGLRNTTSGYGAYGINIASGTGTSNIEISNNFISDILTNNYGVSTMYNPFGIRITGGTNHKIWHNSVNLFGNVTGGSSSSLSAPLLITSNTVTGLDVRNNIFANAMVGSSNSKAYAIYIVSGVTFTQIDNNNYYATGVYGRLGYSGATDILNLAAWRLVTLKDNNSISANPNFLSPNNLHTFSTSVDAKGTPIAGIVDDIDGDLRHATTPDMGADEFDPLNWDLGIVAILSPSNNCGLTNSNNIIVNLFNNGLNTVTGFNISYTINGGTPVSETFSGSLASDSLHTFTFAAPANLSAIMPYTILVQVNLTGDQYVLNDTLSIFLPSIHNFANQYTMGFEPTDDMSGWSKLDVNADGTSWLYPYNDVTNAHSGNFYARYPYNSSNPGNDWLFSNCFTLNAGLSYKVEYWYKAYSASLAESLDLKVGTDKTPAAMTTTLVNMPVVNNTTYQKASAIFIPPTSGTYYFGWHAYSNANAWYIYLDDINIRMLPPKDAGVTELVNITPVMNGGDAIMLQAKIRNFGADTLFSIPVKYSVNGGTPVTETWMGTLLPDSSVTYTFATALTTPINQFNICAWTQLTNDGNTGNDTTCVSVFGIPLVSIPFEDDFEGAAFFYIEGLNNQWQHGVPNASVINTAHSPVNVWATNLTGNYSNSSNYNLYSPRISFAGIVNAQIGFWHWYNTEVTYDGGRLQYTTNNGNSWQTLGAVGDPLATNWYTHSGINGAPAFSGTSGGWVYSSYNLAQFNNFPVPVQFRFNFFANASNNANGWAIDDIEIYQNLIAQDAGVINIITPSGQVVTGSSQTVEVTIKNFGTDPLTAIPMRYRINNGVPVAEQWTGNLAPGATTNFTFNTPVVQTDDYTLCAYSRVPTDTYTQNDTTCTAIDIIPAQYDAGITEILSPVNTTLINAPVTVEVKIKNFGTEPLTSIDLQYDINSGVPVTATWTGTLAPNAETTYTFTQTYLSPSGNYSFCSKTNLSNDQNSTNDKTCKTVAGTTGIDDSNSSALQLGQNMPNPASGNTVIPFKLPHGGAIKFEITNILGQIVYSIESDKNAGNHIIEIDADKLTEGVYFYTLSFNELRLTRKMIVSK